MTPNPANSYSDRTNKRFPARGIAGIVHAPVPIQTSSLKAETGKDMTTMLVKNSGKRTCWGSVSMEPKESSEKLVDSIRKVSNEADPLAQESEKAAEVYYDTNRGRNFEGSETEPKVDPQAAKKAGSFRDWSGPSDPDYEVDRVEKHRIRRESSRRDSGFSWGEQRMETIEEKRSQKPTKMLKVKMVMKRPSSTSPEHSDQAQSSTLEEVPSENVENQACVSKKAIDSPSHDSNPEAEKENAGEVTKPDHDNRVSAWIDPIDTIQDEGEKAKRRQDIALEQQQLVLKQVQAARELRNSKRKQVDKERPVANSQPLSVPVEDEATLLERRQHQRTREPRTKGVLFKRLADGSLVRTDRFGEPLPKPNKHQVGRVQDKDDIDEDKSLSGSEDASGTDNKTFVPAPIPEVSAWTLGPPPSVTGILSQKSAHEPDPADEDATTDSTGECSDDRNLQSSDNEDDHESQADGEARGTGGKKPYNKPYNKPHKNRKHQAERKRAGTGPKHPKKSSSKRKPFQPTKKTFHESGKSDLHRVSNTKLHTDKASRNSHGSAKNRPTKQQAAATFSGQ